MKYLFIISCHLHNLHINYFFIDLLKNINLDEENESNVFFYSDGVENLLNYSFISEIDAYVNTVKFCRTSVMSRNLISSIHLKSSVESSLGELSNLIAEHDRVIFL